MEGNLKQLGWDIKKVLEYCDSKFLGRLIISSSYGYKWGFNLFMGRITGEFSGVHTIRRWKRLLSQNKNFDLINTDFTGFLEDSSATLDKLVKSKQISRQEASSLAKASILESFFDILQLEWLCSQSNDCTMSFKIVTEPDSKKDLFPWFFFSVNDIYKEASADFGTWEENSLGRFSPNLVPVIKGLLLQNITKEERKLLELIDGNLSIRDLSLSLQQNPLLTIKTILPFVETGMITLKAVSDIVPFNKRKTVEETRPIVAYVEDNPIERDIMKRILSDLGCNYVSLFDPLRVTMDLIKVKPSLVFLDLVIPIVNGYEICAQLRRIPSFREIPIIILTSNNGIIDRARAKVVGATDFCLSL
ncbi:MAG: hypothetical protein CV045_02895 [Cyanobacteria bacterium M5B4]|nr:MAG: hypothetical protein CV045_02895 [Cyanobacteria bacterium M5B4]